MITNPYNPIKRDDLGQPISTKSSDVFKTQLIKPTNNPVIKNNKKVDVNTLVSDLSKNIKASPTLSKVDKVIYDIGSHIKKAPGELVNEVLSWKPTLWALENTVGYMAAMKEASDREGLVSHKGQDVYFHELPLARQILSSFYMAPSEGFGRVGVNLIKGVGEGLEWQQQKLGSDIVKRMDEWEELALVSFEDTSKTQQVVTTLNNVLASTAYFYLGGGLAMRGFNTLNFSPKLAFLQAEVGSLVSSSLEAMIESGETYSESIEAGENKELAIAKADSVFMANLLTLYVTNRLGFFSDKIKNEITRRFITGNFEGIQEGLQELYGNLAAGRVWHKGVLENYGYGFFAGFLLEGGDVPLHIRSGTSQLRKQTSINTTENSMVSKFQEVFDLTKGQANKFIDILKNLETNKPGFIDLEVLGLTKGEGQKLVNEALKYKTADEFIGTQLKQEQLKIVEELNPMTNNHNVGIRSIEDIKTLEETLGDLESFVYPDFSKEMAKSAIKDGNIKIYSSKPLNKVSAQFVSPSKMMATDYAGGGEVFSKIVKIEDVAWINGDEGVLTGNVKEQLIDIYNEAHKTKQDTKPSPVEWANQIKSGERVSDKIQKVEAKTETKTEATKEISTENKGIEVLPSIHKVSGDGDVAYLSGEIAYRKNAKGDLVPAVRQKSGIYAPKAFETFNFNDVGGKYLNFVGFASSIDGITIEQAVEQGWGPMFSMAYDHNRILADRNQFISLTSSEIGQLLKDNGMVSKLGIPNKADGEIIFHLLEGKSVENATDKHKLVAKELRKTLDGLRETANKTRLALGKSEIGYIKDYAPHIQKTSVWQDIIGDNKTTISDNFDFVIPNEIKNPHFRKRYDLIKNKETNVFKLLDSYVSAIAHDIYTSPMIEQLKAVNSVLLGRGMIKSSDFINRYIRENLTRKPATLDNYVGAKAGSTGRKIMGKITQARNLGALTGNILWTIGTQPISISLTVMETGFLNTIKGVYKYHTNKAIRKKVKNSNVIRLKSETGIGTTLGGDIDRLASKINKTGIDQYNDFMAIIGNVMEDSLTGASVAAGYEAGVKEGLTGKDLDIYADLMGQVTQSMYNPESRPLALNSMATRLAFPFQTYFFETYRHIKVLAGRKGGIPKSKKRRLIAIIRLIVATMLANWYAQRIRGNKVQSVGSFIPFAGSFVDEQISKLTGKKTQTGRSPIAPMEDIKNIQNAIQSAMKGDFKNLRKEMIFWSLGLSGIGGATQINRLIDGIYADSRGYVESSKGDKLFEIKGIDKATALVFGPYGTKAGKEFLKTGKTTYVESLESIADRVEGLIIDGTLPDNTTATNYLDGELNKRNKQVEKHLLTLSNDDFVDSVMEYIEKGEIDEEFANKVVDKYINIGHKEAQETDDVGFFEIERDEETFITQVIKYAYAIGTNPIKAYELLFKGEKVRKLNNGAIVVHRMPMEESEDVKRERGVTSKISSDYKLDHTIPLQLGGDNTKGNLRLVTTEEWAKYTPVENFLGSKLRSGEIGGTKLVGIRIKGRSKMSLKEAKDLLLRFKDGEITAEEIYSRFD